VNKAIVVCAAISSFIVTAVYLQTSRQAAPARIDRASPLPRSPGPSVPREPLVAASLHEAPPAPDEQVEAIDTTSTADGEGDSVERRQLAEYVAGISNMAPVSVEQQRSILESKLRRRKDYETVLRDSGLERETLSAAERAHAHRVVARALSDYRESFLLDVKPVLSDQQFDLLSNYEETEFRRELERLQIEINAK
jgi:hypothetical protein